MMASLKKKSLKDYFILALLYRRHLIGRGEGRKEGRKIDFLVLQGWNPGPHTWWATPLSLRNDTQAWRQTFISVYVLTVANLLGYFDQVTFHCSRLLTLPVWGILWFLFYIWVLPLGNCSTKQCKISPFSEYAWNYTSFGDLMTEWWTGCGPCLLYLLEPMLGRCGDSNTPCPLCKVTDTRGY